MAGPWEQTLNTHLFTLHKAAPTSGNTSFTAGMPKGLTPALHSIGLTNIIALAGLEWPELNATQPFQHYLQK